MSEEAPLRKYDYYQGPKVLAELWQRKRDTLTMKCVLSTHRLGWELKLTAGASFSRALVCRSESEVHATSAAWQAEAKAKGWS